jgi:hypothetical protein
MRTYAPMYVTLALLTLSVLTTFFENDKGALRLWCSSH